MKKLGIFLLVACMAVGFAGCKDKEDDGASSKADSAVVSQVSSQDESISSSEAESAGAASIDYDPTASMDVVSETASTESVEEIIEVLD